MPKQAVLQSMAAMLRMRRQAPVSWFSMKLTARDGHIPRSPGGRPWLSMSRQNSPLPMASCRMPALQRSILLQRRLAAEGMQTACALLCLLSLRAWPSARCVQTAWELSEFLAE